MADEREACHWTERCSRMGRDGMGVGRVSVLLILRPAVLRPSGPRLRILDAGRWTYGIFTNRCVPLA